MGGPADHVHWCSLLLRCEAYEGWLASFFQVEDFPSLVNILELPMTDLGELGGEERFSLGEVYLNHDLCVVGEARRGLHGDHLPGQSSDMSRDCN